MTISKEHLKDSKEHLKDIEVIQDHEIDYSDIPETDEAFWEKATVRLPDAKQGVYIRLDSDVLEWFKQEGKGYQTRINAVLRSYYEAHKSTDKK